MTTFNGFCKHCGFRLPNDTDLCARCGANPRALYLGEHAHGGALTMPPEHVLRRRKSFPLRDELPMIPKSAGQGVRVMRKRMRTPYWYAFTLLGILSLILLAIIYSLLSMGYANLQSFLLPTPGALRTEVTPFIHPWTQHTVQQGTRPTLNKPQTQATTKARGKPRPTPLQAARSVIQRYYVNINAHNYQAAYALWLQQQQSYFAFASGFAHTLHDEITFGTLSMQDNATVHVPLTIHATETSYNGTSAWFSSYEGYYLVQRQSDHSWKIIMASFVRI